MRRAPSSESSSAAAPGDLGRGNRVPARRIGRRFLVWLGGILAVFLGLSLLGAGYESMAKLNPPPLADPLPTPSLVEAA